MVAVPRFDVDGYFERIERYRAACPQLRIGTGLEVGQPHLHLAVAIDLDLTRFDRIFSSLHTLKFEGVTGRAEHPVPPVPAGGGSAPLPRRGPHPGGRR